MRKTYGIVLFLISWQVVAVLFSNIILPSPTDVLTAFFKNYTVLALHILYSVYRLITGIALAILLGMPIGILLGYSKKYSEIFSPIVYILAPLPKIAFLPLIMLIFGIGNISKIFIIFIIMIFQVIISAQDSVKNIPEEYFVPFRTVKASSLQIIRHIIIPATLPDMFTALRIGLSTSISVLFFAENYGTTYGIGFYTMDMWLRMDYKQMYLGILALGCIGLASVNLTKYIEKRICKWRTDS